MLDFNKLEKILEEMDEEKLFNQFIVNLLDYSINDFNKVIIRYKIDNGLIIDIFDYALDKKFIRYYFVNNFNPKEINEKNIIVKIINLNNYYNTFDRYNKFSLFSTLFYEKNINLIEDNISNLFNDEINNIIMKHLKN